MAEQRRGGSYRQGGDGYRDQRRESGPGRDAGRSDAQGGKRQRYGRPLEENLPQLDRTGASSDRRHGSASGNGSRRHARPDDPAAAAAARRAHRAKRKAKEAARKTGVTGAEVPRKHEPILAVRPFSSVDFSQLLEIMPPEWYFAAMSEAEVQAQAQMDLAQALSRASVALVATIDDGTNFDPVTVGFLLARVPSQPLVAGTSAWLESAESAEAVLRYGSPQARGAHAYVSQLDERGRLVLEAAGEGTIGQDNELLMFAVAPSARGCGAGTALVGAFEAALREAQQQSYWLQTDTACTWEWYDEHGFVRLADVELGDDFLMPPGDPRLNELPDFEDELGDDAQEQEGVAPEAEEPEPVRHRAMLYRKDLTLA